MSITRTTQAYGVKSFCSFFFFFFLGLYSSSSYFYLCFSKALVSPEYLAKLFMKNSFIEILSFYYSVSGSYYFLISSNCFYFSIWSAFSLIITGRLVPISSSKGISVAGISSSLKFSCYSFSFSTLVSLMIFFFCFSMSSRFSRRFYSGTFLISFVPITLEMPRF